MRARACVCAWCETKPHRGGVDVIHGERFPRGGDEHESASPRASEAQRGGVSPHVARVDQRRGTGSRPLHTNSTHSCIRDRLIIIDYPVHDGGRSLRSTPPVYSPLRFRRSTFHTQPLLPESTCAPVHTTRGVYNTFQRNYWCTGMCVMHREMVSYRRVLRRLGGGP